MMDFHETFTVAMDALRANKMRAVLTSLGVIIGSASIVLVVTVALTSKRFVLQQIESVGSNLVWVEMIKTPDKAQPLSHELTLDDMETIRAQIPQVVQVAGVRELPMTVVARGVERPVNLVGVTQGYQEIRRLLVLRGRYFDSTDMEKRDKVCLITKQLATRLFGPENAIGRSVRMGELTFAVVGVFVERVETFGLSDIQAESVLIPFGLMKYYTGVDVIRVLDAQADSATGRSTDQGFDASAAETCHRRSLDSDHFVTFAEACSLRPGVRPEARHGQRDPARRRRRPGEKPDPERQGALRID